ncbi:hypothetical protein WH87_12150 [Devosia epidermidihirudinis]|uniref:GP-PDE domain-containing protein n=1 Tax=Devosia epidermidihirudinis TaxID=1293439 RepID=A0A0F5Q8N2_9HYPH|nr:glycerophosphodiester phosphodiesterase family protein [Devosia epidermidihirudinis]KKC37300.1 hypothetical protein WH87_12150 [Devosia epidermidihirudinis]
MPRIVAHRGRLDDGQVENALSSMQAVIAADIEVLEIDLRLSKDGHCFVLHDETLDRCSTGSGPILDASDETLAALKLRGPDGAVSADGILSLDALLDWTASHPAMELMLDAKHVGWDDLLTTLSERNLDARCILLTFSPEQAATAIQMAHRALVSVLVTSAADIAHYADLASSHRLALYVPQDASLALFATAKASGHKIITDAVMPVAGGALDSLAATSGDGLYRDFCALRPVDYLVTDRPLRVQAALP